MKRKEKLKGNETLVNKLQVIKSVNFFFDSPPRTQTHTHTHTHGHTHTHTHTHTNMYRPPPLWCVRISSVIV